MTTHPAAPSVFVSSTVREFADLRSSLHFALRERGVRAFVSEAADFDPVGDSSAITECLNKITESDVYLLIIGTSRGALFDDEVSVTRQEYRTAKTLFESQGKPRLLMFVRSSVVDVLELGQERISQEGIDDEEHLRAFIDEVQSTKDSSGFLKRFRNADEVLETVVRQLNLGRSVTESVARHLLLGELASIVAKFSNRHGRSVSIRHQMMDRPRKNADIREAVLAGQHIEMTKDDGVRLSLALVGRAMGAGLPTAAIDRAITTGLFLEYDPELGSMMETTAHRLLMTLKADILWLRSLDEPFDPMTNWSTNLLTDISAQAGTQEYRLGGHELAMAYSHFDRCEDIYAACVSLMNYLLGKTLEPVITSRRPLSPLGDAESKGIAADKADAHEVLSLVKSGIFPFGTRIPPENLGDTHEEQIQSLVRQNKEMLANLNLPLNLDEDFYREVAESTLAQVSIDEAEGIERLERG